MEQCVKLYSLSLEFNCCIVAVPIGTVQFMIIISLKVLVFYIGFDQTSHKCTRTQFAIEHVPIHLFTYNF